MDQLDSKLVEVDKSCTKILPYVSPRVVIRVPDIHRGLNQTVVSISDSDPCSPCDMTFKDISKTLCSPRTEVPDSVRKSRIQPSAAVRKVDVVNQSFDDYGKQLLRLDNHMSADLSEKTLTEINLSEEHQVLFNTKGITHSGSTKDNTSSVIDYAETESPILEEPDHNLEQGRPLCSPITFYSSPNFDTVHWGSKEELFNVRCSEIEAAYPTNHVGVSNEFSNILNTPPNPSIPLESNSKQSNCFYSEMAYKYLDMKSPPNVNIFDDHPVMNCNLEGSKSSVIFLPYPVQISPQFTEAVNQNLAGTRNKNSEKFTRNSSSKTHPVKEDILSQKENIQKHETISKDTFASKLLIGSKARYTRNHEDMSQPEIAADNVKTTMMRGDLKLSNQIVSQLKRKHKISQSSSSDDESVQTGDAKKKVLSSCRSYRQYKHLKKSKTKHGQRIKDFVTPYTIDETKIHAPFVAKTPKYCYSNASILPSQLHGMPQLVGSIPHPDQASICTRPIQPIKLQGQFNPLILKSSEEAYLGNTGSSQLSGTKLTCGGLVAAQNVIMTNPIVNQQFYIPQATLIDQIRVNTFPGSNALLQAFQPNNFGKSVVHTEKDQHGRLFQSSQSVEMEFAATVNNRVSHVNDPVTSRSSFQLACVLPEPSSRNVPSTLSNINSVYCSSLPTATLSNRANTTNTDCVQQKITGGSNGLVTTPQMPHAVTKAASCGKVNVQSYSYPIKELTIGKFKYLPSEDLQRDKIAVLQIRMESCLLVYELELHQSKEDLQKKICPFALIEISFQSLCHVRETGGSSLILEVNSKPEIFLGHRQCDRMGVILQNRGTFYKNGRTLGEIGESSYHQIEMLSDCAQYIVNTLTLCVEHMSSALKKPLIIQPKKQLKPDKPDKSCGDAIVRDSVLSCTIREESQHATTSSYVCHCTQGCQLPRCGCQYRKQPCTDLCHCHRVLNNCNNPQSVRHKLGISFENTMKNACLMANSAKINMIIRDGPSMAIFHDVVESIMTPEFTLQRPVEFPCCGHRDVLQNCLTPAVTCPVCSHATFEYSWCLEILFNEETEGSLHCQRCKKCIQKDMYHCEICGRCHSFHDEHCGKNVLASGDGRNKHFGHQNFSISSSNNVNLGSHASESLNSKIQSAASGSSSLNNVPSNHLVFEPGKATQVQSNTYQGFAVNFSKFCLSKHVSTDSNSDSLANKVENAVKVSDNLTCPVTDSYLPMAELSEESGDESGSKVSENTIRLSALANSDVINLDIGNPLCTSSPIHGRITK